jgi:hypothetical protein
MSRGRSDLHGNKCGRSVKAITRLSLVPKIRMHGRPLYACAFFSTGIILQFSFACFNRNRAEIGLARFVFTNLRLLQWVSVNVDSVSGPFRRVSVDSVVLKMEAE